MPSAASMQPPTFIPDADANTDTDARPRPQFQMPTPRAKASDIQKGERLALFNYYEVTDTDSQFIHCTDENGQGVRIGRAIVDHSMVSTSQYHKSEKVSRTRLAQLIETVGHAPFRVTFDKQVQSTAVADALEGEDLSTKAKRRKVVSAAMKGEERVMHARLWRSLEDDPEMELGRYKVVDLEKSTPGKPAQRLVDTRTVKEVIVEGVRYYT